MFSKRVPDLTSNEYAALWDSSLGVIDLIGSNPTQCGFRYPDYLSSLTVHESRRYRPDPMGHQAAREALAAHLSQRGSPTNPENLVLTASTSEAYGLIFKLLADPGEALLCPAPGYPLIEHLARLEGLRTVPYRLKREDGWPVDLDDLERGLRSNPKLLITIQPHHPTGCCLNRVDQGCLMALCAERSMAFISDEVFMDYALARSLPSPASGVLTFGLGGLSKSLGLPQLKLAWIRMEGPDETLREARERLEFIADAYLNVNTPVQNGLKDLLAIAPDIQGQIHVRITENMERLERGLAGLGGKVRVWPYQGGWSAMVEILGDPRSDEEIALSLLKDKKVAVHPGSFYDFQSGQFLILSLIPPIGQFAEGVGRIAEHLSITGG